MDVATLQVDRNEARERFQAYRAAMKEKKVQEVDALMLRAYQKIAQGKMVLDLYQTFEACMVHEHNDLPVLAVCRADAAWCHLHHTTRDGHPWLLFHTHGDWARYRNTASSREIRFPGSLFAERTVEKVRKKSRRAKVPFIPPEHRPKGSLDRYHILWEADWEDYPVDPILLRHIGGYLYQVEAQWDLTDVERAVLRAALS